ncbi:type IV pilin protein [Ectopseudomonas mendocina]|uniref:type IV pilin protein n=1 Tax=Ectopseudomonas mendocina TaxID=300 RepID=UPI003EFE17A3
MIVGRRAGGFTLIEIMLVIAVLGVLSVVAFPVYQGYSRRAANHACLAEAKAYANIVLTDLNMGGVVTQHIPVACDPIPTPNLVSVFLAVARAPGDAVVSCDLFRGGSCTY